MIIWMTGQPGHGKTTLSDLLKAKLDQVNKPVGKMTVQVDGDDLRKLTINKDYSEQGRINNIRNAQMIAEFCHNKGMDVIVSLVSPYRWLREEFKERMEHFLIEYYITCDEPRERDHFHVDNYEPPEKNFYLIDTTVKSPEDSVREIVDILEQNYGRF